MRDTKNLCKHALEHGGSITPLIVDSKDSKHMGLTNPSILKWEDKWLVCLRNVGYALYHTEIERDPESDRQNFPCTWGPLIYMNPEDDVVLRTTNFMCELDEDYMIKKYAKTDTSKLDVTPIWDFIGLEDARLVEWDGKLYQTGVRRDTTTNGEGRMELSTIEKSGCCEWKETERVRILPPDPRTHAQGGSYCEKNWMPILDMPFHYVKWTIPTEIVKVDPKTGTSETVALVGNEHVANKTWRGIRGDSQVVKYGDYYVALTHEVDLFRNQEEQKDTYYWHKFIVWDKEWNIKYISNEFRLTTARVEFSCGMAFDGKDFLITFGFVDHTAFLLKLPSDVFEVMVGMKEEKDLSPIQKPAQEGLLIDFIMNPKDPNICFNIAENYFNDGHYASSMGFYLRAADYATEDENLRYNARYMTTKSLSMVGHRDQWEEGMWWNVIDSDPERPEGYLALARYYEWRNNHRLTYQIAKLAVEKCKKFGRPITSNADYSHFAELELKKMKWGAKLCKFDQKKEFLLSAMKRLNEYPQPFRAMIESEAYQYCQYLNDNYNHALTYRPIDPPYPKYKGEEDHSKLRRSFKDAHTIKTNYSANFQDMFVLSTLDGKRNGRYLEIGAAEPYKGNNTALLEEWGWTGISLELNSDCVKQWEGHRKNRIIQTDALTWDYGVYIEGHYDFLQVDIEPALNSFKVLQKIPWEKASFGLISFEHDDYLDCDDIRKKSREYLKSKGYKLLVSDISPTYTLNKPKVSYEDWWYHPDHVSKAAVEVMKDVSKGNKNAINYIYNTTDGAVHTKDLDFVKVPW
tara:strand:+ start:8552 stop:10954 length:2403 start_codon:yes stop_codon:yes gene_type:complete